nr:hypothetical protein [Tanacetum cinerariifolium]
HSELAMGNPLSDQAFASPYKVAEIVHKERSTVCIDKDVAFIKNSKNQMVHGMVREEFASPMAHGLESKGVWERATSLVYINLEGNRSHVVTTEWAMLTLIDAVQHGVATDDVHSVTMSSRLDAISSVFEMDGLISDSNYSAKKTTMVLFINEPTFIVTLFSERLVECSSLKRAIEIVYAATLPKASNPFIYMPIGLPPDYVDVNVHPTKTGEPFESGSYC